MNLSARASIRSTVFSYTMLQSLSSVRDQNAMDGADSLSFVSAYHTIQLAFASRGNLVVGCDYE